jgi:hypothetical protein
MSDPLLIKALTSTGVQYFPVRYLDAIQVDNNSATDWYVRGVFGNGIGNFAIVDGFTTESQARDVAAEVAAALGLIDAETFK